MIQDEIIRMAQEAGIFHAYDSESQWDGITNETLLGSDENYSDRYRNNRIIEILAPFAALVAAHEREALAEQSKCACDSPAWCTKYRKCNREMLGLPKAQPVKQQPVAYRYDQTHVFLQNVKPHFRTAEDRVVDGLQSWVEVPLYAAPVDAKAIRSEALEEAAELCDRFAKRQMHPAECAAAIRGLK